MSANLVALRDAREQAIARLSDAFSHDVLDVDEFERRLALAHQAEVPAALEALVADLAPAAAPPPSTALATRAAPEPVALEPATGRKRRLVAIMGGVERKGPWLPPRALTVTAVMGGVDLDFREAQLAPGVTEVSIFAFMGGVNIVVPPTLALEMDGVAIMGGFAHEDRAPRAPDPDRPLLRIHGFTCMGGVNVETRLPGESGWQARRRQRRERRALRRAERRALPPRSDEPSK